jgi:transglutaminase-like putative cysteine protease
MRLTVVHSTAYRYAEVVSRSTQYIRLTPANTPSQTVVSWQLDLPAPAAVLDDAFGNVTHVLAMDRPHQEIRIVARGEVEVTDGGEGDPAGRINPRVFLRASPLAEADDAIRAFVEPFRALVKSRPLMCVTDLMHAVLERLPYESGHTEVHFSAARSFAAGRGVCQDHAHVFIACCRELGVPARYVSGYVYTADFDQVASHAWVEAWMSGRWASFDISNARHAGEAHVKLAVGLDYLDACPVRGVRIGGGEEALHTSARIGANLQE